MRWVRFLPAVLAALTDCLVTFIVRANQQDYPDGVIVFQAVMFAAALAVAAPQHWVRFSAFLLLIAGAFITGFSVGVFYVPTVIAAAFSVSRE
jgi:hypothetical protein